MAQRRYWLFKSEPTTYSFSDLLSEPDSTAEWDGVRNYQARNLMRDELKIGDGVLFYHSSTASRAVVGTARVVQAGYPDHTAWDPNSGHFDPKSSPDNPIWFMVDIQAEQEFARTVTLNEIKQDPRFKDMMLVSRGARLSIQPVGEEEWEQIIALGNQE